MRRLLSTILILLLVFSALPVLLAWAAVAQTLTPANVQIEWKVVNRFRFFRESRTFEMHERAWQQYLIHVDNQALPEADAARLRASSSVLGTEHVLNDRYIPFSRHLRSKYDPMGWASHQVDDLCWDAATRKHAACGGVENYITPKGHEIELWLRPLDGAKFVSEYFCNWRIDGGEPLRAPCDEAVRAELPWPGGGTISVNVDNEGPIEIEAKVKDLLIVGLGDSFASGEGNPDVPVMFSETARFQNLYPRRARNDAGGNAQWIDQTCHRSLYGHQLRAALQLAVESPRAAVTFMGYACSGAAIDEGILGPQTYVEYRAGDNSNESVRSQTGGSKDNQLYWLLRELCLEKPDWDKGQWVCPGNKFRRNVDHLLLSIGGNDIGFSYLVAWAALRDNTSSSIAKFFGATVSPKQFAANVKEVMPGAYARLARAIERAIPLNTRQLGFDPSRIILTAYPDILEDEKGNICAAGEEGVDEGSYPANQSLDMFASWLVLTQKRLTRAHDQLEVLHQRMAELAEDHGWTYAARAYGDRTFRGHGFCAQSAAAINDPAEQLTIPCWGKAGKETQTCESSWSGKVREWRPYNPQTQNYPYALRQRWVRTFNDAYMVVNQKVTNRSGQIDAHASQSVFSETTGAMHPNAEGHAAMADAILMDLRPRVLDELQGQ